MRSHKTSYNHTLQSIIQVFINQGYLFPWNFFAKHLTSQRNRILDTVSIKVPSSVIRKLASQIVKHLSVITTHSLKVATETTYCRVLNTARVGVHARKA